jgi:hypothetical protein
MAWKACLPIVVAAVLLLIFTLRGWSSRFGQRSALAKKEMPVRPTTPGSNRFSPDHCPLSPVFSQVFTVVEIGIERFAHFLDQRDLAMLESFAPSNDEQAAPGWDLHVGDLEGCDLGDPWTRIAEQGGQRQGQSVITTSRCFCRPADRIPFRLG